MFGAALGALSACGTPTVPLPTGQPGAALISTGPGSRQVFWRDRASHQVYYRTFSSGGWSAPVSLGSNVIQGVGAAVDSAGVVTIATVGTNKAVIVRTRQPGGSFSPWQNLGGAAYSQPAVVAPAPQVVRVLMTGANGIPYMRTEDHGRWGAWVKLPGALSEAPAAARLASGALILEGIGTDKGLYELAISAGGIPVGSWAKQGGRWASTPAVTVDPATGDRTVAVRNVFGVPETRTFLNARQVWTAWSAVGSTAVVSGLTMTRSGSTTVIAAFDRAGSLDETTTDDVEAATPAWSGLRPISTLIVPPTTKAVSPAAVSAVVNAPGGTQTVTLASSAPAVAPGDIIASDIGANTPDGLLAKVTGVTTDPATGASTVTTTPATLPEAVANGSFDVSASQTSGQLQPAIAAPNTTPHLSLAPRATNGSVVQAISKNVSCSGSASASITGSISVVPSFHLSGSWSLFGGVTAASFTGTVTEDADLKAALTGAGSCNLAATPLLPKPIKFSPITFTVGPIPVVVEPELQFYLDGKGSISASVTTEARQRLTATAGLNWTKSGGLHPVSGLTNTQSFTPPTATANAGVEVGVAPKLSLLLYGLAGPEIDTRGYLKFSADTSQRPWWTLKAGLSAGASLVIPALKVSFGNPRIIGFEKTLAQATTTPPGGGTPALTVTPASGPYGIEPTVTSAKACPVASGGSAVISITQNFAPPTSSSTYSNSVPLAANGSWSYVDGIGIWGITPGDIPVTSVNYAVTCRDAGGHTTQQYQPATVQLSAGLTLTGGLSQTLGNGSHVVTIRPNAGCPIAATSVQITATYLDFSAAQQSEPSVSVTVPANGSQLWGPANVTLPASPTGSNYVAAYAECDQAGATPRFFYTAVNFLI